MNDKYITLGEILEGTNGIHVKEYEAFGETPDGKTNLIFIGGTYWANGTFIPISGGYFSKDTKVSYYSWGKNDNKTLLILRAKEE